MASIVEQLDQHAVQAAGARPRFRDLAAAVTLVLLGAVGPASAAAASPETITCGEVATHSIVVGNDLSCASVNGVWTGGLKVGADDITIDLNGHTISTAWAPPVSSVGHSYVTVENGTLQNNAIALDLRENDHDTVRDVTAAGGDEGDGMYLSGGSQNSVIDSTPESSGPVNNPALELNNETGDVISGNTAQYDAVKIVGAGNQLTRNSTVGINVAGSGNLVEGNAIVPFLGSFMELSAGLVIAGDQNNVVGNSVYGSAVSFGQHVQLPEGVNVTGSGNLLSGNKAVDSIGDGIHVLTSGNTLVANVANNNGALGIEAAPGVIDGGQNQASGNGNPIQCINIVCSAPMSHVPATPSGLTATPATGSVALSWNSNPAGDGASYYSVYRTDQWFSGPWATTTGTSFTNASAVLNGTRYCYQVSATNATGESARTAPVCATPTGPSIPVPSAPTGLTVTPGNGSVALSWQPNPTGDAVTYYSVYRTDQTFSSAWATLTGTAYGDSFDVVNGTRYCYQLSASNGNGESAKTAPVCATPSAPPAPLTQQTPPALPPAPRITGHPAGVSTQSTATFGFTDGQADVVFKCRLDGGAFSDCTSPRRYAALRVGQHTFRVHAVDSLGHASGDTSYTWTVKGTVKGTLKRKYVMTFGNIRQWTWSAVVDRFYGARGATKLTAFRVARCTEQRSGRFRCDVSWRKSQYAFAGTVTMGSLNSSTGKFKFGFSLLRRNTMTGATKRLNLAY